MKLLHFIKDDRPRLGLQTETGVLDVSAAVMAAGAALPVDLAGAMAWPEGPAALEAAWRALPAVWAQEPLCWAPAVPNAGKILCVGLNYAAHAAESGEEKPKVFPPLFPKYGNCLAAHEQTLRLPADAQQFDYEAELVVVMGKTARCVSPEEAPAYIFGYTAGNDFSARDLQFLTSQWMLGKACDDFAPVGPVIVSADTLCPDALDIGCAVNGTVRQRANTSQMLFSCREIVSFISRHITLEPGDLIFTGTPEGVILGRPEQERRWLRPGDEMQVTIEGIGTLTNRLG